MKRIITNLLSICALILVVSITSCNQNDYVKISIDTNEQVVATDESTLSVRKNNSDTLFSVHVSPAIYGDFDGTLKTHKKNNVSVLLKINKNFANENLNPDEIILRINGEEKYSSSFWEKNDSIEIMYDNINVEDVSMVFEIFGIEEN